MIKMEQNSDFLKSVLLTCIESQELPKTFILNLWEAVGAWGG